jgi:hypothetical protein
MGDQLDDPLSQLQDTPADEGNVEANDLILMKQVPCLP